MQHLLSLAEEPDSWPSLIVSSSLLPDHPEPTYFTLSLVKAAQRNLMRSLYMTYRSQGVVIGLINVGGPVLPGHKDWSPPNIAEKTWEWLEAQRFRPTFEVK